MKKTRPSNRKPSNKYWCVPPMWTGETVYLLGGAPSIALFDIEKLRGRRTIAINNAFQLASWIDICFYGDCRWLEHNRPALKNFRGLIVSLCPHHNDVPGVLALGRDGNAHSRLSKKQDHLAWNSCSGAAAVDLAVHLGAAKIVLVGFDMRRWGKGEIEELKKTKPGVSQNNWHQYHHRFLNDPDKRDPYWSFLKTWPGIARALKQVGVECVLGTPGSKLTEHFTEELL